MSVIDGGGVLRFTIFLEWVCTMKLERFKEKNNKKRFIVIFTVCCILLLAGVLLYNSFAVFTEEKEFNVINGRYQDPGDIYFAYYVDGVITRDLPKQNTGYIFDEEQSNCTNGVVPTFDNSSWTFEANYSNYNATDYTRTKCNLYFKTGTKTVSTALGDLEVYTYTPDFTKSACDDATCESHEKGIFETTDDDGVSYYYRGSVENNYVSFAGYYWRIIRINGNGSIRMIYDGTSPHENGEKSTNRYIGTGAFNVEHTDSMYAGYMYTSGDAHGTANSSAIKTTVDNFYKEHLQNYTDYFADAGFCGDRNSVGNVGGRGTYITYYETYTRTLMSNPSLLCTNENDLYTTSSSSFGNRALIYPVGLMSIDEAMLAGHAGGYFNGAPSRPVQTSNFSNYLYGGYCFYTISPSGYYKPIGLALEAAYALYINENGQIDDPLVSTDSYYIKPVINIRSDVTITGDGTMSNPYQIS